MQGLGMTQTTTKQVYMISFWIKGIIILLKQLMFHMLMEGSWRKEWRLLLRNRLRERFQDDLLLGRFTENRPRNPNLLLVHKPSMENTFVPSITQDLNSVTNVHNDGVRYAFCSDPLTFVKELEPGYHVVEYERECTHVGVSFNTEC
ncbi:hypothetical protein SSX86_005840 [Deinandra increscens subsp. villosa]|uniref:Uncharacterized protein n=1 Tax=Deinandra increscens subsp. villosa TaxID=3103831 RepID=A0AAP0H786_9ASTR